MKTAAKWSIVMNGAGVCTVVKPGGAYTGSLLVFEHEDREVIGLTQAYSTCGGTDGKRYASKEGIDAQRVYASEVAARVVDRQANRALRAQGGQE